MHRRLVLLVGAMLLLGMALTTGLVVLYGAAPARLPAPGWLAAPVLVVALVLLTCLAEVVAVRIEHAGAWEELGLFEAAVLVNALLLPPARVLAVTAAGLVLASALRRRSLTKTLFNVGMHTASTAALVLIVLALDQHDDGFTVRLVLALLAGTTAFATVNLGCLSVVLRTIGGTPPRAVLREEWRLSALMVVATVATGATAAALLLHAPVLLPFTALPAVSLTYAYRARANQDTERQRAARLLGLSEVLAGRSDPDELLNTFVTVAADAFGSDDTLIVLVGDDGMDAAEGPAYAMGLDARGVGYAVRRPATSEQRALLARVGTGPAARQATSGLPTGWRRALVAPLEAGGARMGVVAIGWRRPRGPLPERDLMLLTSVASALAFALRGAEHLRRLVAETSKLQSVVDQSSDGILVVDGDGTVAVWSPALATLTGCPPAHALGRPVAEIIESVDDQGDPVDFFAVARGQLSADRPRTALEVGIRRPDGEQRWARAAHAAVFADHFLVRDVVIIRDVTRERAVDRLKADFIATVSHELRTPVTPIKGYAELLRSRGDRLTPDKRRQALESIIERADHLARLVEDLLLASKVSADGNPAHQVHLVPADLAEIAGTAVGDVADDGRVRLDLSAGPAPVSCDPLRARQVIVNLVSNALKYSTPPSVVGVTLIAIDAEIRLEVTDSGRGIPADQIDRVFEKFHRVEDPMRMTTGGTGLGLYIARQLAQAMHGRISVRSTLGMGSTFALHLPRRPSVEAVPPTQRSRVGSAEDLAAIRPAGG